MFSCESMQWKTAKLVWKIVEWFGDSIKIMAVIYTMTCGCLF
jgi:hypothetical protein